MGNHDVLVPLRFLSMVGHVLATLLALFAMVSSTSYSSLLLPRALLPSRFPVSLRRPSTSVPVCAQRDNVIVALRFHYAADEYKAAYESCVPRRARAWPPLRRPLTSAMPTCADASPCSSSRSSAKRWSPSASSSASPPSTRRSRSSVRASCRPPPARILPRMRALTPLAASTDLLCHTLGGLLISAVVIQKAHYVYLWYIFAFFSAVPLVAELAGLTSVLVLRKRRW